MTTRFEDETNTIRDVFWLDVNMNGTVRDSQRYEFEPEGHVAPRKFVAKRRIMTSVEVQRHPIMLTTCFHFKQGDTGTLIVVFSLAVSINEHLKKSKIERTYNGARNVESFNDYSKQYLNAARKVTSARCDEYALSHPMNFSTDHLKNVANDLHDSILTEWSRLN